MVSKAMSPRDRKGGCRVDAGQGRGCVVRTGPWVDPERQLGVGHKVQHSIRPPREPHLAALGYTC